MESSELPEQSLGGVEQLLSQGRIGEALHILSRSTPETPAEEHLAAAALLLDIGDFEGACRRAVRALLKAPDPAAVALHDEALRRLAQDARAGVSPSFKRAWFRAHELVRTGDPAAAAGAFEKLARQAPAYLPVWAAWRGALEAAGRGVEVAGLAARWEDLGGARPDVRASLMGRRLSGRGLLFDPREAYLIRRKERVLTRVASAEALRASAVDAFHLICPGGARRNVCSALTPEGRPDSAAQYAYETQDVFVAALADAAVVGRGAVITRRGELIEDLMLGQDPSKYGAVRQGTELRFADPSFRDGLMNVTVFERPAFLMTGPTDRSFGDWMLSFVPRLALAEAAGLDCDVVIRNGPLPNAVDMLAALGVPRSRIVLHDSSGVSIFPRLYVPSWPMPSLQPMDGQFDMFRGIPAPVGAPTGKRLYLSRLGLGRRRLVNEAEVEALFVRHGFEVVRPETLSVEQLRRTFAHPACIAAPYGSALLNLAFCKSRPQCLFLIPPERRSFLRQTSLWMAGLGLSFRYLLGDAVAGSAASEEKLAPWRVDLAEVEERILRALGEAAPAASALAVEPA